MAPDVAAKLYSLGVDSGPPWLDTGAGTKVHSPAQIVSGYGPREGKLHRGACEHHPASSVPRTRPYINDVISAGRDLEVVFDDDECRSLVNKFIKESKQSGDIGVMKPRSWFIQDDTQR